MQLYTERLTLTLLNSNGSLECFEICQKDTNVFVGYITLLKSGEISYFITLENTNHGFATEALIKIRDYAIDTGLDPFLNIYNNKASIKVAQKAGFVPESAITHCYHPNKKA